MNERIKSLMDRAEYQAKKQSGYEDWEVYVTPDSQTLFEKFTKLIVLECMKMCDEVHRDYGMASDTARISKRYIKKHFGVEE